MTDILERPDVELRPDVATADLVHVEDIIEAPDPSETGLPRTFNAWLSTTNHKAIGVAYGVTALIFMGAGGTLAGLMRAELATPGMSVVDESTYNSLFTMHGSAMMYLFAIPFGFALANYLVPLMIGAPDMAFPRLNALSYWLYLFGGLIMFSGFLTTGGAAAFGWFAYAPLSGPGLSTNLGADLWVVAVILTGTSGTLSAINVITTTISMRMPGMTMFRLPIMVWNLLLTSVLVLMTFPVLSGALMLLMLDRRFGAHFYDPTQGGSPILWQHLFWFFGHPEVYIAALPFWGVVTEIFPVFSRRPVFGYKGLVFASLTITVLSASVWAHHMFVTGEVALPFFAATSFLIGVPTGVKIFNWIGTMWGGSLEFKAPMIFAVGFLVVFVAGGVTGIILASAVLDFGVSDTYFVVAHFHYVLGGTVVFAVFAALYFWWPKVTGRFLSETLARIQFVMLFIGFNMTFLFMHILGLMGMPRRVADYRPDPTLERWNLVASIGYLLIAASFIPFLIAVYKGLRGPRTAGPDPWDGHTLEWCTSSPPPEHNFDWLPPVRSERPVFDLRWIRYPGVTSPGELKAWNAREGSDPRWFPLGTSDTMVLEAQEVDQPDGDSSDAAARDVSGASESEQEDGST